MFCLFVGCTVPKNKFLVFSSIMGDSNDINSMSLLEPMCPLSVGLWGVPFHTSPWFCQAWHLPSILWFLSGCGHLSNMINPSSSVARLNPLLPHWQKHAVDCELEGGWQFSSQSHPKDPHASSLFLHTLLLHPNQEVPEQIQSTVIFSLDQI